MNLRPIEILPGYFVSSCGRVFRQENGAPHLEVKYRLDAYGYPIFTGRWGGRSKEFKVHRIVAITFLPRVTGKNWVCHRNDVKTDNRAANLYWGSPLDNGRDRVKNGLTMKGRDDVKGTDNPRALLTEQQVYEIRALYTGKRGNATLLANIYGVSATNVTAIGRRLTWTHLPDRQSTALDAAEANEPLVVQGSGPSEGPIE